MGKKVVRAVIVGAAAGGAIVLTDIAFAKIGTLTALSGTTKTFVRTTIVVAGAVLIAMLGGIKNA